MPCPITATQEMLDEAVAAYHRLMTGGGVYEYRDQNGEVVRYSRIDLPRLATYIQSLRAQLHPQCNVHSGPMKVWM